MPLICFLIFWMIWLVATTFIGLNTGREWEQLKRIGGIGRLANWTSAGTTVVLFSWFILITEGTLVSAISSAYPDHPVVWPSFGAVLQCVIAIGGGITLIYWLILYAYIDSPMPLQGQVPRE